MAENATAASEVIIKVARPRDWSFFQITLLASDEEVILVSCFVHAPLGDIKSRDDEDIADDHAVEDYLNHDVSV